MWWLTKLSVLDRLLVLEKFVTRFIWLVFVTDPSVSCNLRHDSVERDRASIP